MKNQIKKFVYMLLICVLLCGNEMSAYGAEQGEATQEETEDTDKAEKEEAEEAEEKTETVEDHEVTEDTDQDFDAEEKEEEGKDTEIPKDAGQEREDSEKTEGTETEEQKITGTEEVENMTDESTAERILLSFYIVNEDEEEALLEEKEADEEGYVTFPADPELEGYCFEGWALEDGTEVDEETVFEKSEKLYTVWSMEADADAGIMLADAGDGAIATDSGSVEIGQVNTYSCTKSVQTWTVPASGKYRITCRGGHGGSMNNYDYNGGAGSVRAGTMKLKKGEVLYIYVGGNGESGGRCSHGSAKGNTGGYNGGADSDYDEGSLGRKGRYWTHGSGGGASDVRIGGTGLDNQIIVAGGGGGANKETGGKAADTGHYNGRRLNGSGESGGGGYYGGQGHYGGSSYIDTAYFEDITEQNGVSGSGAVIISVEQLYPDVALKADTEWTTEDIVITATAEDYGKGLPEDYLSWENDDEGNDIWTDETSYTVSQNGTYTCKIRDEEGNIGETSIEITNIDRLHPEGELTADITDWTREDVTLTITADDAEATEAYAKSGLAEPPYLWGYRDEKGNVIWESKEVGDTGEAAPTDPAESGELTDPAGASGEQAAATENPTVQAETGQKEAEETPETEESWTDETTYTASQNGTYLCRVRDKAGNESTYEYTVSNIDRTAPEVDYKHPDKWYEGGTTLTWKAADLQPDGSAGCGLHETPYSYNGTDWTTNTIQEIQAAGTYRIWVRDKLENIAECTFWVGYDKRPSGKKGVDILEPELLPEPLPELLPETDGDGSDDLANTALISKTALQKKDLSEDLELEEETAKLEIPKTPKKDMDKTKATETADAYGAMPPTGGDDNGLAKIITGTVTLSSSGMILYFVCFYILRSAGIMAMNADGEYVFIGRRRIKRRRGRYQIYLDSYLCSKADTGHFKLIFGKQFAEKNEGRELVIKHKNEMLPAMIKKEVYVEIALFGDED